MTVWSILFTFLGGMAATVIFIIIASFVTEATPKVLARLKHRLHCS